ncbi:substrate binding domain-containing protein [Undibacterium arcticum]
MDWIAEFLAAHPQVRIEFLLSDARADLIGEGIDLAFRGGKILEPNLVARQIGTSRATLVASTAYLAARGVPATLADLEEHDCITFPKQSGRVSWTLDGPDGAVEVKVAGRFSANTAQVLLNATLANLGIALLPTMMAAPYLHAGRLKEVLPEYALHGQGIHFVLPQPQAAAARSERIHRFHDSKKIQDHGLVATGCEKTR